MTTRNSRLNQWNPWKLTTIGMAVVLATALITGIVVANISGRTEPQAEAPQAAVPPTPADQLAAPPPPPAEQGVPPPAAQQGAPPPPAQVAAPPPPPAAPERHAAARPSSADIEACNRYASSVAGNKTTEAVTNGLIGGALGAALGAASGAIAGGGSGAGKGAGIGGLVGAAAGTIYGLNKANQGDAHAEAAYRACMRRRGYTG
jgi:outer membrane biosynthesis protein TonB